MKKAIAILITALLSCNAFAQKATLQTNKTIVSYKIGNGSPQSWSLNAALNPDILETTASCVTFMSDIDTIKVNIDEPWGSFDFDIVAPDGKSYPTRILRKPSNALDNPNPKLLKISPSGLMSREQAEFDINALIYNLNQVHPDIFSVCDQAVLMRAVNTAISNLPDSISIVDLYLITAPIVAMIGDGHTNLSFPMSKFVTPNQKRMPMHVNVLADKSMTCRRSYDSLIPKGAKIISINGKSSEEILDAMLPFCSGERQHFRLSRVEGSFTLLYRLLFPADKYAVTYRPTGEKKTLTVTLPALTGDEMANHMPQLGDAPAANYSYTIDETNNVAIMDFRSFAGADKMAAFANSMFAELKSKNIGNLIIDLRENGGGNSAVGDTLLRYISPVPFNQMPKCLVKITPTTLRLMGGGDISEGIYFYEFQPEEFIKPLSAEEGHYNGNVILLTSNHTFSSAGSFSWAFKECGIGLVIGEETGGMNVCYGDILFYYLPISNMLCTISYKRFWQMNADEREVHGTLPDIEVPAADAMKTAYKKLRK